MTAAPAVLGLDLGTSGLKGVLAGPDGQVLASARAPYPTRRPAPGRAEQDPSDWAKATAAVVGRLLGHGRSQVQAIGLSGMIPTLVTLDQAQEPLGPAITWEDSRAQAEGSAIRTHLAPDALYRTTGQWLDGRYLLPMLRWLMAHEPGRAGSTRWVASAKDHLFRWLTGELATDPSTATGFGAFSLQAGDWDPELCVAMGAAPGGPAPGRPGLPPIRPATATAPLAAAAAHRLGLTAGLPVALGGADSVAGALGLGARRPGSLAHLAGTSTVLLGLSRAAQFDPGHRWLVTPLAGQPGWGLEMDLLATGSALAWLGGLLGLPDPAGPHVVELATRAEPGAGGVVCLPYLGVGEQGALWDPGLRGVIGGLSLATGPAELARALLDGILVETRRCTDVLALASGAPPGPIHADGWTTDHPQLRQWLADATGRVVLAPPVAAGPRAGPSGDAITREHVASALGAAQIASLAVGAAVAGGAAPSAPRTEPDPEAQSRWAATAARHDRWRLQTDPGRLNP